MRQKRSPFIRVAVVLLALCASCAVTGVSQEPRGPLPAFQKGIAYTGYSRTSYDGDGARLTMKRLAATRARWVQVLVTGYQDTVKSTLISRSGEETPSDPSLIAIIRYAQSLGLKVLLKPHVDLLRDPTRWRGQIGIGFSEAEWNLWFSAYRGFIVHYAALAKSLGVELFCVGCELDSTVRRKDDWVRTIALVRAAYDGPLIYADDQLESDPDAVQWWDALDYVGMDTYPTLTTVVHPSVDDFAAGWAAWLDKLRALSRRWRTPVILTEIGYRSVEGGAQNPWDWQREGPVDLEVQANAYEAALRAVQGEAFLRGMYWWQWSPNPQEGGAGHAGYTPQGKPAAAILTSWYKRAFLR